LTGAPEKVVHDLEEKIRPAKVIEQPIVVPDSSENLNKAPEAKVKHVLTSDVEVETSANELPSISDLREEVVENASESSIPEDEPQKQVSMTFEFDLEEQPVVSNTNSEEPEIRFNLIDETEEEPIENKEREESLGVDDVEVFDDMILEETSEELLVQDDLSFQINTESMDEKPSIHFSLDESDDAIDEKQKIVHTLCMDDDDDDAFSFEPTQQDVQAEVVSMPVKDHSQQIDDQSPELSPSTDQAFEDQNVAVTEQHVPEKEEPKASIEPTVERASSTHSKAVQEQIERAQKRKERLQKFNYRFRNNSVIDKAESEPAYKRQGVELNQMNHSSEETLSRLSLSTKEDGELELKSKNSFLHDNVD